MKNILTILTFSFILISCSKKESTNNRPVEEASLKFKLDAEQQVFTGNAPAFFSGVGGRGTICGKVMFSPGPGYRIQGYNVDSVVSLSIITDSLHTGTYDAYSGGTNLGYYSIGYYDLGYSSGNFTISITRHNSGTIDGNFSGKLFEQTTNPDTILITEGVFKNVRVSY